jgi:magnesium-transporting ATPase (P-type)
MSSKAGNEEPIPEQPAWHCISASDCFKELSLSEDVKNTGLTTEQAEERLAKYGFNQLSEKEKETLCQKIWAQVANVLVGILVFVAIVSAIRAATSTDVDTITTNWIQVGIIVAVISINTTIGIIQEGAAEEAAEALKAMLASDAIVIRNGKDVKIETKLLVPGDIVKLGTGDRMPADIRLLEVSNYACAEAALTGESVPIDKKTDIIDPQGGDPKNVPLGDRTNMAYSSTLATQGSALGLVISTGDYTEIGTINALVSKVEKQKTNVLKQIDTVSKYLAIFILMCAVATFLVAWLKTDEEPVDALSTALVAAVAMIPEGLEAIVTVVYAYAVSKMADENAIIRALPAVETLGSVTVICSDKTGTLTQNIMSLVAFVTSDSRYRVDVNSKDRTPTNFVNDPTYMAERADHAKFLKANKVISSGPSSGRYAENQSRHGKKGATSFPYGMSAHANFPSEADLPESENKTAAPVSDANAGKSPDSVYLRTALSGGVLCSKCTLGEGGGRQGEIGNPTELSILRAAYFGGVEVGTMKDGAPLVAEVPFSSEYKFMATIHEPSMENDGKDYMDELVVHVKGAPDRMIPLCKYQAKGGDISKDNLEPIDTSYWVEQIAILSSHGLRVLALTRGTVPKGSIKQGDQLKPEFVNDRSEPWLTIVGLCAIMDPPRPECVQAVTEAHGAGVRVAMITGDHRDTALAIGGQLGLVDEDHSEAITGPELDAMNEKELEIAVQKYNVFARASPQNKIQIVKALQAQKEVCGMTGDGVNDAPALKAADMGVAMGKEGTDVAREAAEMVLADDNFATIIKAVEQGRTVWDNLRKVLLVNTPINNAQGLSVFFGLLLGLEESPLSSIQVLYSNLICAVTLGFICAVEPAEPGIMDLAPRRVGKRLIGRFLFLRIAIGTLTLTSSVVGAYFWVQYLGYNLEERRSQALNTLNFGAIAVTVSARFAYNPSYSAKILKGNKYTWYSIAVVVILQLFITYTPGLNDTVFSMAPMDGRQWGIVIFFQFVVFFVMETEKAIRRHLLSTGVDTDDRFDDMYDKAQQ